MRLRFWRRHSDETQTARQIVEYRLLGHSSRGHSHIRSGKPNQDAIRWWPDSGAGQQILLAVSDGHGHAMHFRSDRGSEFAVRAAQQIAHQLIEISRVESSQDSSGYATLRRTKIWAEKQLPKRTLKRWLELVGDDLAKDGFGLSEILSIGGGPQAQAEREAVWNRPELAYGATLLVVVVTQQCIVYAQIGDGDILTVLDDSKADRSFPVVDDDTGVIDEITDSLCQRDALPRFRVTFRAIEHAPPELILVATDGYSKSFNDPEEGFQQLCTDILKLIREHGLDYVRDHLETWLSETSRRGVGDDITLGIIYSEGPADYDSEDAHTLGA